ncbi:ADP-ribosyltransferase [Mycobacterium persicum]|uniref:Outer membrane channel protein CpnT n=1 Tax=Mycobacterium persicum TaxID=1487726 RepID=A0AB38UKZ2_9MYCO|nr:ADP-ribosyltransferase [Mycobacterium persicum]ORB90173.1 hypothetical protein B1T49_14170 [Mycobacterium persicum]VAZ81233.1 Outer membrane channel protein CpnT [Mycobacterium persicum]
MTTLAVDPAALDGAGAAVVAAGENLGAVTSTLTGALAGSAGMAGDDPAGAQFGRAYDETAATVLQAMAVMRNGLCNLGDGVRMTAHNYSVAEAMSDVAGRAAPLPVPQPTSCAAANSAPSAIGNGDSAPAGWGWVAPYIGMIWPNGDSGKLRAAAAAWRNAGTQFAVAEIHATAGPMNAIRAQQLPEAGLIEGAFSDAYSSATAIVGQCQTIATGLDKYAAKIDAVHAAILDLLSRICDPMTGIKEVWEFLTDEDEDEIARIAHDIATLVDNFTGEVDALGNQIGEAVAQARTTITNMGRLAAKEWDQFLQGNPVGWLINFTGQRFKGMGEIVWGLGEAVWNYNEIRAVLDPVGFGRTAEGALEGVAPLVGLGGDHAPGWLDSWKEVLKDTVHWDDWARSPGEAYGKMEADVATNFLPEGPVAKLEQAREAADKLKAFRERLFGTRDPGGSKPPEPPTPPGPKTELPDQPQPPTDQQPQSGSPTPGPQSKPGAGDNPLPKSPTESKTSVENRSPTAKPVEPSVTLPTSPGQPDTSAPAELGEHPPPTHAPSSQPVQAKASGPTPQNASVAEPTLAAPSAQQSAPTLASSHTSTAQSIPDGVTSKPPPSGGASPSGIPSGQSTQLAPSHETGGVHGTKGDASEWPGHDSVGADNLGSSVGGQYAIIDSLNTDDLSALTDYTGNGFTDLNSALRSGVLDSSQLARVNALNRALEKLPAYDGAVVRGTNLSDEALAQYEPGKFVEEKAFMSTSTDPGVARSSVFVGNVEFRVLSKTGRDVSAVSIVPHEQEILFPARTIFYVVSKVVDPLTGQTIIDMIER